MNKAQLKNLNGHYVRLQPAARGSQGEERDDDWVVHAAGNDAVQLVNARTGESVALGSDHIFSYFTDAARTTTTTQFGFLQLHSQVRIRAGKATVEPLPPPVPAEIHRPGSNLSSSAMERPTATFRGEGAMPSTC